MADEPISALTQVSVPPFSSAFTNPSTGAMLEILDTTNTSMASTGTNSKIAPGDLIMGYLAAGSNVTLTETAGIVTIAAAAGLPGGATNGQVLTEVSGAPAWANPVTKTTASSLVGTVFNITKSTTTTPQSTGFTISLPTAGTYLILGAVRCQLVGSSVNIGDGIYAATQLHDNNLGSLIPGCMVLIMIGTVQAASVACNFQQSAPIGPAIYTVTQATTVELYAYYNVTGSFVATSATISSDIYAGETFMSAIRLY